MDGTLSLAGLVGVVLVCAGVRFFKRLHDAANSIATVVSTRVLRPQYAVIWAAFFNFVAFLFCRPARRAKRLEPALLPLRSSMQPSFSEH